MGNCHGHSSILERSCGIDAFVLKKNFYLIIIDTISGWCPPFPQCYNIIIINGSQNIPVFPESSVIWIEVTFYRKLVLPVENNLEWFTTVADSLDTVELVMAFEEEFGAEIPDGDAEKLNTVGSVVTYLKEKGIGG
mgnify:CR=1 FL=1